MQQNIEMKAYVNRKFGSANVLNIQEVKKPVITEDTVLIKNYATSVNTIDIVFRSGEKAMFGLARLSTGVFSPKKQILGFDFAGEIIAVGEKVTDFKSGDRVFGGSLTGSNAEFSLAKSSSIAKIPSNINFNEAAAIPMVGLSALQALKPHHIKKDQEVLIYGASGGIGTIAVQLAKAFGGHVTAVASGKNEKLVRDLGADKFIDYTKEDFTDKNNKYDVIFDTVSKARNWKKSLKEDGVFINAGSPSMSMIGFITAQLGNKFRNKKYSSFNTEYLRKDLEYLAELIEQGKISIVIDKIYPFEDLPNAHIYYEQGHTAGKVVVEVVPS